MQATFSSAFLRGDQEAARFFSCDFRDPLFRERLARQISMRPRPCAPELLAALHDQIQRLQLSPSAARDAHLEALDRPGTIAVVTGQQVGLFLGPLLTFYKAASAVAVARAIQRETHIRCVPIFWLQTEDHDYEEINHCHILASDAAPLRLQLAADLGDADGARVSVAHRRLGADVTALLNTVQQTLETLPQADEFLTLLRKRYQPGETLAAAFGGVLAELFAEEGLLLLDPRCAAIATLAAPLYRQALQEHDAIAAALSARTQDLRAAGYSEQVHVRKDTALVFFHDGPKADPSSGPRYRLQRHPAGWAIPGRVLSEDELLTHLAQTPLRFSTSALLRPLVQDTLLPTVAYVGGPGEINYLAQLAPLYPLLSQTQPLVVPRARFRCLEDHTLTLLRKLDLQAQEAETSQSALLFKLATRGNSAQQDLESRRHSLLAEVARRLDEFAQLDTALHDAVRKTHNSIAHNLDKFAQNCRRVLLERDQVTKTRVERLQTFLFPQDTPQERYYALPYFACKYGLHAFKQKVLAPLLAGDSFATLCQGTKDLHL